MNPPSSLSETAAPSLFQQGLERHRQGEMTEAAFLYHETLIREPAHAGAWHFLGVIALSNKEHSSAIEYFEKSLSLCTTKAVYYNNYAVALKEIECYRESQQALQTALRLDPNYADAWSNLGVVLSRSGENDHAIETAFQTALRWHPEHPDALSHYAEWLGRHQRFVEQLELLNRLERLRPNDPAILQQIAHTYASQKRYDLAIRYQTRLVESHPNDPNAHHQIAVFYGENGQWASSKRAFQHAASLPHGKSVWRWKHLWYCPVYFENAQRIDDYWHQLDHDLDAAIAEGNVYDWRRLPQDGFTLSFQLPHHNRCCRGIKEKFAKLFAPSFAQFQRPPLQYPHRRSGKIRVGFLVTPGHEGGFLRMMRGVMERLDASRYETFLIYHRDFASRFQHVGRDFITHVEYDGRFEPCVQRIRGLECDLMLHWKVAADLWSTYLPMTRLAPIQCTSWGTHGTGGIPQVDYSLTWDKAEPCEAQDHYTETLFRMKTMPYFEHAEERPPRPRRHESGLPETGALYFCPHRLSKYHPMFDGYLRDILAADPSGHVVLLWEQSTHGDNIRERMRRTMGDPLFRRMIFLPKLSVMQYYRTLSAMTVVLDSPVYAGELTCHDAFSVGVPSVTQTGPFLVQRYTTAHYRALEMEGPVTTDQDEYVKQAVRLGTDEAYRDDIVRQIAERYPRQMEQEETVREYERFFEEAVLGYASSNP